MWIVWVNGLTRKPEIAQIADDLQIDRRLAATCCMLVWEWFDENTVDGRVSTKGVTLLSRCGVTEKLLDECAGMLGIVKAMGSAGWLDLSVSGFISVVHWDRWNSKSAKERLLATKRKQAQRARDVSRSSVTKTGPQYSTVQEKKNPPLPPLPGGEPSSAARKEPAAPGKPEGRKARKARADAESLRFATAQLTYEFPRGLGNGTRQDLADAGELTVDELAEPPPRRVAK